MVEVIQTELFRRWLERLRDRRARLRIAARIVAVQEGHFGDWKAIDRTVSELRVHAGPGYRIYFTRRGDKQSQRRDIDSARRLAAELSDPKEPGR